MLLWSMKNVFSTYAGRCGSEVMVLTSPLLPFFLVAETWQNCMFAKTGEGEWARGYKSQKKK